MFGSIGRCRVEKNITGADGKTERKVTLYLVAAVFFLRDAAIRRSTNTWQVLAVMGPERMFGEMSVLSRDAKTSYACLLIRCACFLFSLFDCASASIVCDQDDTEVRSSGASDVLCFL